MKRLRRNRKSEAIRAICCENRLHRRDLVLPLFVTDRLMREGEVPGLPGVFRQSIEGVVRSAVRWHNEGISAIILFPDIDPSLKTACGSAACVEDSLVVQAIYAIKERVPNLCVMADVALDPYTTHGHDGLLDGSGEVDNDRTVAVLVEQALLYSRAGCDVVAPSDMMDGRVGAIRSALDSEGYVAVSILAYSAKYASLFYGPFRGAVGSHVAGIDKSSYQLPVSNRREAINEALIDEEEGADLLLVKPAAYYLDVLSEIKGVSRCPVGAYQVSGEYAMLMAADKAGFFRGKEALYESLLCIKRAGADFIVTYGAPTLLDIID
ncbi:MAG: porphobilinogen synthase [Chlamydiota bacterium]|nr:porphobilinogen synthase [Chlamydiota bacterium]